MQQSKRAIESETKREREPESLRARETSIATVRQRHRPTENESKRDMLCEEHFAARFTLFQGPFPNPKSNLKELPAASEGPLWTSRPISATHSLRSAVHG